MSRERPQKVAISVAWRAVDMVRRPPPRLTILYYHGIPDDCVQLFDEHMAHLAAVAKLVHCDYAGPLDPLRPTIAVTFDDAFRTVRTNGLDSLEKHRIPATIFAPSAWLGRAPGWPMEAAADGEEVMSAAELRSLPKDLIRIGSHSAHHPHMSRIPEDEALVEFRESRAALEDVMGEAVDLFAYPHGNRSERTDELAAEAGYRHVFSVVPEAIPEGRTAILRGRDPTYPTDPMWVFRMKVQGAFGWIPVASRMKRRLTGRSRGSRLEG